VDTSWAQHAAKESMMSRRKQHRNSSKVKTEALQLPAETDEPYQTPAAFEERRRAG
jgi:hypothetical protein